MTETPKTPAGQPKPGQVTPKPSQDGAPQPGSTQPKRDVDTGDRAAGSVKPPVDR